MWKRTRKLATIGLIALSLPLLAGCSDGKESKAKMEQALNKQTEMTSCRFNGSAELELSPPGIASGSPLAGSLQRLLAGSKLEWSGVAATRPVRLESEVKLVPSGSSAALMLPMIIKDNKLFVHIPLLNAPDEYTLWDMAESGQPAAPGKLPTENLSNAQTAALDVVRLFVSAIEPDAFKQDQTNDLVMAITEKNAAAISEAWAKHRQAAADILSKYGLATAGQLESLTLGDSAVKLLAPGELRLSVDESGFIREMTLDLRWQTETPNPSVSRIRLHNRYEDVNQNPAFAKEELSKVKPFGQIAAFLPKP